MKTLFKNMLMSYKKVEFFENFSCSIKILPLCEVILKTGVTQKFNMLFHIVFSYQITD